MIKKALFLSTVFLTTLFGLEKDYKIYKDALKKENYLKAKVYLLKSLDSAFDNGSTKKAAIIYNKIGNLYSKTGEYYKSIEYYKLSLKLNYAQKDVNEVLLLKNYNNLSNSYSKIGNIFKAFKFSYKAVAVADKRYGKNSKRTKEIANNAKNLQSRLIEASI